MKKSLISIAAAALLTSTMFVGCGSNSSSTPTTATTVKVSDGYVVGAKVWCGTKEANEVDQAKDPGTYECTTGVDGDFRTEGGTILGTTDIAVNMSAPKDYSNVTPLTTFIVNGLTPAQVADAFGLPSDTDFDVDVVKEAKTNPKLAKAVKTAAVIIAASSPTATTAPSATVNNTVDTTTNQTTASNNYDPYAPKLRATTTASFSLADFINAIKEGKTVEQALEEKAPALLQVVITINNISDQEIMNGGMEVLDTNPDIKTAISQPEVFVGGDTNTATEPAAPADQATDNAAAAESALPGQDTAASDATTGPALPGQDTGAATDTTTEPTLPGMDQTTATDTTADTTTTGPVLPGMDQTTTTDTAAADTTTADTTTADTTTADTTTGTSVVLPGM